MHFHFKEKTLFKLSRPQQGWIIVLALFSASAVTVGSSQYSFGLFVAPLESEFGWSRTQINAALSLGAVGGFLSPLIGRFMDRRGSRLIMTVSLITFSSSFLLRSMMSSLWHWYALSLVQAISMTGAAILPTGKLVGLWFQKSRGRILGLTAMGNNFGGFAVQPLGALIVMGTSWQIGYFAFGILSLIVALFALTVVSEPHYVSDVGAENPSLSDASQDAFGWTVSGALQTKAFYAITLAIMLGMFTYGGILPHVSTHLNSNGVSIGASSAAISMFAISGMFGKAIFGAFADKIGARLALMIDLVGQAIFAIILVWAGTGVPVWLAVIFMGFFFGSFGALYQLIVMESFGLKHFGGIMGIITFSTMIPMSLGPLIAGISFDRTGSYDAGFFLVAGLFLVGAISLTQAKMEN